MISENKFPKYSDNNSFENLTDYCLALNLLKKDIKFKDKKVNYIELSYLDNVNSFCWLIEEGQSPNKETVEEKTVNIFYVNANYNKLEIVKESKNISIACTFGTLTKKEKTK